MKKYTGYSVVGIFMFLSTLAVAKENVDRPKLVVGIVVDQMRYDFLYRYYSKYAEGGFKKLLQGYNCKNTKYNYVPTYTGPGHACIYTGTGPAINGIVGNDWYDRFAGRKIYCVQDNDAKTVGDTSHAGQHSPKNLLSSTIGDELRLSNNFKSKVIGIALKDRGAILPAGFKGEAYWYSSSTGNWISSSYYKNEVPAWVKSFNEKKYAEQYLKQTWNTLLDIKEYSESSADDMWHENTFGAGTKPVFPYDLSKLKGNGFGLLKSTPYGNTFTKDFAIEAIKNESLGKDEFTDLISISFSSTDYIGHQFGPNSIEVEDTYLRLDRDIEDLIKRIELQVGKENVLFFLTADHGAAIAPAYARNLKIPGGSFNGKKVLDSLNKFLSNVYKASNLISDYSNQQVYLNYSNIEKSNIQVKELQERIAAFLSSVEGVANVTTSIVIKNNSYSQGWEKLVKNGFNTSRSGDIIINLKPGWMEGAEKGTTHGECYSYDTHVPLVWYGWKIQQGETVLPVAVSDIASTLSMILNISFPSGNSGEPINVPLK